MDALEDLVSRAWTTFTTPPKCAVSARERRILGQASSFSLPNDGGKLDPTCTEIRGYEWSARTTSAPTVLVVHGWGGCAAQFASFVGPLQDQGLRVVAFDAPAHGESPGTRTNLFELAASVEAVSARYGSLHAIVGHSLGAAAAVMVLSRGLTAERAALIAPSPRLYDEVTKFVEHARLAGEVERRIRRHMESRFGPELWERTRLVAHAPRLAARALLVHDRDDPQVDYADSVELAEAWPESRLFTTSGLGHLTTLRTKAVVVEVARHLAG